MLATLLLVLSGTAEVEGIELPTVPTHEIPKPSAEPPKIVGQPIPHPPPAARLAETASWWERLWTDPVATFTMAVALFTLCLVAVSAYQGKQLSRTASVANRAAEDAEQAMQAARDNAIAAAAQAEAMDSLRSTAEAQERVMQEQAKAMSATAGAARQSAEIASRALTELERPFVYAEVTQPGLAFTLSDHQRGSELQRGTLELSLLNFGRTPASLTRLEYQITTAPHGDIASPIDPRRVGGRELPIGTVSADAYPHTEATNLRLFFFEEEQEIVEGRCSVWLVGFVRYNDIFGNRHVTGFAKVFDGIGGRFVTRGGDAYNYARTERSEEIPTPSSMG